MKVTQNSRLLVIYTDIYAGEIYYYLIFINTLFVTYVHTCMIQCLNKVMIVYPKASVTALYIVP